jgi:hypothetical protein
MPKKLVKLDLSNQMETRYPTQTEVDLFLEYARGIQKKLAYTMMKDSPCRPRVFPMIRWNWLEPDWWTKDVVHVSLPKELRRVYCPAGYHILLKTFPLRRSTRVTA